MARSVNHLAHQAKRQSPAAAIFIPGQQPGFPLESNLVNEAKKTARNDTPPSNDPLMRKHEELSKALDAMYRAAGGSDRELGMWRKLGHMPTNPIHARSRLDSLNYLARLRLPDGQKVLFRQSRMLASNVSASPIECFEITRLDGSPVVTLYVALDGGMNSKLPPEGFLLESPGAG